MGVPIIQGNNIVASIPGQPLNIKGLKPKGKWKKW